ncbi:dTDP-4-dehydrorhamnose reductase [Candidatus Berkelbacteria bacterium]|nr:dTDP-4-dehydrorhamnose reductase [Candidatus Berkelbacteria bacterium]
MKARPTMIIGANGALGSDLVLAYGNEALAVTHAELEVGDESRVQAYLKKANPQAVINTAAYHQLDECERNPAQAFAVNALGALYGARACAEIGAKFLYVSTDYVFDGAKQKPYLETDKPNPESVYAVSKLAGEQFALHYNDKAYVVRTCGLYGATPSRVKGTNFVLTMLKLAREKGMVSVVDDQFITPTSTRDLANQIKRILEDGQPGLYHATSAGSCSWYEFAEAIFVEASMSIELRRNQTDLATLAVKRPTYSVLENQALKDQRIDIMRSWRDALKDYLRDLLASQSPHAPSEALAA